MATRDHSDHAVDARPIGMMDSGVGGLSILREFRAQLPNEDVIYVADQGHVPYGPRSIEQVREFTFGIVRFLLAQHVKLIVIACNTASAAALYALRAAYPDLPFVGMEPAVKPAASATQTGIIGVIATEATFQGELYASVVGRFAQGVRVETLACPEFVTLVERGEIDTIAAFAAVHRRLAPLLAAGIDQLVLGCTHFPFLADAIRADIGPAVTLVDPSPAVARQAGRVLTQRDALNPRSTAGQTIYYTSGDPVQFGGALQNLLGVDSPVRPVQWIADTTLRECDFPQIHP